MIQNQGQRVPSELKPRYIDTSIHRAASPIEQQKEFFISYCDWWQKMDILKITRPGVYINCQAEQLLLFIWWDMLGIVYYELFQPNETITATRYREQLIRLSEALMEKRLIYEERHKSEFATWKLSVICWWARKKIPRNAWMESSSPYITFNRQYSFGLLLVSIDVLGPCWSA